MLHEGALQRVQLVAVRQALDGPNLFTLRPARRTSGRSAPAAVDQDRAGAAYAVLAADVRAGLPAILANGVDQGAARLDADGVDAPLMVRVISARSVMRRSFLLAATPRGYAAAWPVSR